MARKPTFGLIKCGIVILFFADGASSCSLLSPKQKVIHSYRNDSLVSAPHSPTPIEFHQDPPYFRPDIDTTFGVPDFVTDIYLER